MHNKQLIMNEKYLKAEIEYLNTDITLRNVCKNYKIDRHMFSNYLKSKNINTRKKISSNDTLFEIINNEEKAYWLGFLYADGSITHNIKSKRYVIEVSLSIKDILHLEKFKKFLNCNNQIKIRNKTNSCRILIYSKKMCEDLIKLGCIPKKSLILKFPNETQVPKHLINHFIRGYFDGDGCISFKTNSNSPKIDLLGTLDFVKTLNTIYKDSIISKDKRHLNNTYSLRFKIKDGVNFLYDIYNNSNIYLDRKFDKYNFLLNCRSGKKFLELLESKNGED